MKKYYIRGSDWNQDSYYLVSFIQGQSSCTEHYNLGFRILKLTRR